MQYFHCEWIIILVIVMKTFDNVLADCTDELNNVGYTIEDTGLDNYVRVFRKYSQTFDIEEFDVLRKMDVSMCKKNHHMELLTIKNEVSEYECYLLVFVNDVILLPNPKEWCLKHSDLDDNLKIKCENYLNENKFIFTRGIDNYAFFLTIEDDETKVSKFHDLTNQYVEFLKTNVSQYSTALEDTTNWCTIYTSCQCRLQDDGFYTRFVVDYPISENEKGYNVTQNPYENRCDTIKKNELAKSYCNYLKYKFNVLNDTLKKIANIDNPDMLKTLVNDDNVDLLEKVKNDENPDEERYRLNMTILGTYHWCQLRINEPNNKKLKIPSI